MNWGKCLDLLQVSAYPSHKRLGRKTDKIFSHVNVHHATKFVLVYLDSLDKVTLFRAPLVMSIDQAACIALLSNVFTSPIHVR